MRRIFVLSVWDNNIDWGEVKVNIIAEDPYNQYSLILQVYNSLIMWLILPFIVITLL